MFPSHFVDLVSISTLWAHCGASKLHLWTGGFLTSRVGIIVLLCWLHGDFYRSLDLWNACIRLWACDLQLLNLRNGFSLATVHVLWHYHWFASRGLCFNCSWWHLQLVLVSGFASLDTWLLTLRGFVRKIFKTKFAGTPHHQWPAELPRGGMR